MNGGEKAVAIESETQEREHHDQKQLLPSQILTGKSTALIRDR
jgi:hypothetical protein